MWARHILRKAGEHQQGKDLSARLLQVSGAGGHGLSQQLRSRGHSAHSGPEARANFAHTGGLGEKPYFSPLHFTTKWQWTNQCARCCSLVVTYCLGPGTWSEGSRRLPPAGGRRPVWPPGHGYEITRPAKGSALGGRGPAGLRGCQLEGIRSSVLGSVLRKWALRPLHTCLPPSPSRIVPAPGPGRRANRRAQGLWGTALSLSGCYAWE